MLHDVGNNRDCDVDVDHRNNTNAYQILCIIFYLFYESDISYILGGP